MKKKHLVAIVGTLALMANVLVPSLALGQQTASLDVGCPTDGVGPTITSAPGTSTQTASNSSSLPQDSFDSAVIDGQDLATANVIQVTDTRSRGVEGCPGSRAGLILTAQATDFTDGAGHIISNANMRIVTSNEVVAGALPGFAILDGEEVFYNQTNPAGNAHDVVAPVLYDDADRLTATVYDTFRTAENYKTAYKSGDVAGSPTGGTLANSLDNAVTLMDTDSEHNSTMATGVMLGVFGFSNVVPGTYTSTITYTVITK